MCGFCSEEMVLNLACGKHAFGIDSPPLVLRFAMQESLPLTRFFEDGLSVPNNPAFARMFLARLIDTLNEHGFESAEYQKLLSRTGFAPLIARACETPPEPAANTGDSPLETGQFAWVLQPGTYLDPGVFADRQGKTHGGTRLRAQYARWWLAEDPDAELETAWEVPDDAHLRRRSRHPAMLERIFLAVWTALICAAQDVAARAVVRTIALTTSPGTPASDALDLWLQRRAALAVFEREGIAPPHRDTPCQKRYREKT